MDPLTANETRVLGALLEKAVTTPDQYPLTVNAIRSASNQKSSREPVMNLSESEVIDTLQSLEAKLLVSADPNLRGRVEKYQQRFCKPPFGIYDFDDAQYAVLTVLMLRGPATPGELRTRTDRLHKFANNDAVLDTLQRLREWTPDALVAELPKAPNRRDRCWAQLFGEDAESYRAGATGAPEPKRGSPSTQSPSQTSSQASSESSSHPPDRLADLESRVSKLEAALAELQNAPGR